MERAHMVLLNMQTVKRSFLIRIDTIDCNIECVLNVMLTAVFGDTLLGVHNKETSMINTILRVILEQINSD